MKKLFGTVVQDAYTKSEIGDMISALDDLCNPNDSYGWASSGIYCFWNYYTKEILYIGLAVDLTERFKQHNGVIIMDLNSCKYRQIAEYFSNNEKLGYSVFLQSPLSQPVISKNIYKWHKYDPEEFNLSDFSDEQSKKNLKILEGILIEIYRQNHGGLPAWNRMSGSIKGQQSTLPGNYEIIKDMTSQRVSPILSRSTLRELSNNNTYAFYENFLHGARQLILGIGISFNEAIEFINKNDTLNTYKRIEEEGYLFKSINL